MKKSKYEGWLGELQAQITLLDGEPIEPIKRLTHTLPLIAGVINDIKAEVLKNGFAIQEEEIYFFKHIKPSFYALQIFELLLHDLSVRKPVGTPEMLKVYFEEELAYLLRMFRTNAFHYHYYKTGATELDDRYFLRNAEPGRIPIMDVIDPLPGFSTTLDFTFARFIAYERLQLYLLDELTALYSENKVSVKKSGRKLKWTGETINLAELAYGIWLTGQLNHGKASMAETARFLEEVFGVHIGDPHRRWQEIAQRKSVSPSKYLDLMAAEIRRRLENELDLKLQKRRSK
jgi:hypothetical protein